MRFTDTTPSLAANLARNARIASSLAASEALAARRRRYCSDVTGSGTGGTFRTTDRPLRVRYENAGRDTVSID